MKLYKKIFCVLVFAFILVAATTSKVMAQVTSFAETIVAGMVYGSDGNPVSGGNVTITCGSASQSTPIASDGSYQATFAQTECKTGDTASAHATTSNGTGSNSASVSDTTVNGPVVDIDIAIVNINLLVPEFGALTGLVSMLGAAASFVYVKSKQFVA